MFKLTYAKIGILGSLLLAVYVFLWIGSPVIAKVSLGGTVTGFTSGRSTVYHVRLDDGTVVYVSPPPLGLPSVGSKVAITRRTHANGRVVHRFKDMFD